MNKPNRLREIAEDADRDCSCVRWDYTEILFDCAERIEQLTTRAEAAEAAIQAALERLDASLFTNAEHQQAKDILRAALKEKPDD